MMGPRRFTMWFSWVSDSMMHPTPCLQMILAIISAQRADRVRGVGPAAAAEIQLVVGVHLREREDLAAALQEAGAQQVVDAQRPAGGGARWIGAAAWELARNSWSFKMRRLPSCATVISFVDST